MVRRLFRFRNTIESRSTFDAKQTDWHWRLCAFALVVLRRQCFILAMYRACRGGHFELGETTLPFGMWRSSIISPQRPRTTARFSKKIFLCDDFRGFPRSHNVSGLSDTKGQGPPQKKSQFSPIFFPLKCKFPSKVRRHNIYMRMSYPWSLSASCFLELL